MCLGILHVESGRGFKCKEIFMYFNKSIEDHDDGPFTDLWRLFAKMPIRRLTDLNQDESVPSIIIPFAGGSDILWQRDWDVLPCRNGGLPKAFSNRVLQHFNVPDPGCRDVVTHPQTHRRAVSCRCSTGGYLARRNRDG